MNKTQAAKTVLLAVSDIQIEERLRPASAIAVEAMIHSIAKLGILNPIHVQAVKGGYRLLDGLHRLAAATSLGMPEVPVEIHKCGKHEGMNIEVEANLARASMSPLDLGVFLSRQKELYEAEYPETKHGAKGRLAIQDVQTGETPIWSFAANAADALGKDETTVRRLISATSSLNRAEMQQLRSAPQKVSLEDLKIIAKCGDPKDRATICAALSTGSAKSAKAALDAKSAKPGDAVRSSAEKKQKALSDAWARAPLAIQRRFVADHFDELQKLLNDATEPAEIVPFKARDRGTS